MTTCPECQAPTADGGLCAECSLEAQNGGVKEDYDPLPSEVTEDDE